MALEGEISKQSVLSGLARGERASGDLIPWTISQQFQDSDFAGLSGGRIVRIATHPDYQNVRAHAPCATRRACSPRLTDKSWAA